ncbi:MAG: hypothetical protein M1817_005609 [Caeruleum heppii]|nr:MAG: hypothetical protein M1817_005609 [Caeruleum heppii]
MVSRYFLRSATATSDRPPTSGRHGESTANKGFVSTATDRSTANIRAPLHTVQSAPVTIPTSRTAMRGRRSSPGATRRPKQSTSPSDPQHTPGSVPPAVAALLAVTSIPPPKKTRLHSTSVVALIEEFSLSEKDSPMSLTSHRSPMDVLLSPPDEQLLLVDDEARARDVPHSRRTLSSESVPSLDGDDVSIASLSSPPTPAPRPARLSLDRRKRSVSSCIAEDCLADHPLAPTKELRSVEADTLDPASSPPALAKKGLTAARARSRFTSNLTSSLRLLRSAAKSISSLSPPISQADNLLTLSLPYAHEKRPSPLDGAPSPELRRYLNPTTASSLETRNQRRTTTLAERCKSSIQLQTYNPPPSSSAASVRSPPTLPASSPTPPPITPRPREPRENSDFLRVIVLEMNMRKEGKLAETAAGRARFVLPARAAVRVGRMKRDGETEGETRVPRRWVGWGMDV